MCFVSAVLRESEPLLVSGKHVKLVVVLSAVLMCFKVVQT